MEWRATLRHWRDEEVANVVVTTDRAVAVEERLDGSTQQTGRRALSDDRLVNELESEVLLEQVGKRTSRRQPIDIAGPLRDIVDFDQADVECEVRTSTRKVRIDLRERLA